MLEPYWAQLSLSGYDDTVSWALVGGSLPTGLELSPEGAIFGAPTWIDQWSFIVEVTDDEGGQLVDSLSLSTIASADTFLGFVHDRTNNMTDDFGLMSGMWLRIEGGGETGLETYAPEFNLYEAGPNGIAEEGWNDDVMVGTLEPSQVVMQILDWTPTGPVDPILPGYPSGHYPEGSPLTLAADNTLEAGADGGEATLLVTTASQDPLEATVLVVPPDWCPNGVDAVGGSGGPSSTRYCE
ncbi:MAG TPA: hypothetical protein DIU15_17340 [Deltaproteobacteria bacterium]|nr:hypothetical protein [Deltaproteobacteria bacterium]